MLKQWLRSFVGIFFPRLCPACSEEEQPAGGLLCVRCLLELPQTGFHEQPDNPFIQRFWGRVSLQHGAALYHFAKGGRVQQLVHQLKYRNRPDIGYVLGLYYGKQLVQSANFKHIDGIIPVPLHPKKQHQRGYNQAEEIAKGLSESMGVPLLATALKRAVHQESLTQKSRAERLAAVESTYVLHQSQALANKHLLLVDDVLTTGATLEACASQLLTLPGIRLSMVTLAMAE